jgi:GT2 family glycosyltransferase
MIAIVVLTHDRVHLLRRCVDDVLGRTSELTTEIVIWNNGSKDGTTEYLDTLTDPRVRVIHHDRNIGQNAYPRAFAMTTAPYMIELDDDMIDAPPEWDRALLEAFDKLPRVGFLAANLVDNPHDQASRVMYHERPDAYVSVVENGIALLRGPVGGGCAITSRELHDRVGGFRQRGDEVFWLEDEAYINDIARIGYGAAYLKDLQLLHAGGSYYAPESAAKHAYWSRYVARKKRKDAVKLALVRIPLVGLLNARYNWFRPPERPDVPSAGRT